MKQRLSKLALLAVAAAFIVAGFPACDDGEDESSPVVLASIQVQDNPTKTTYSVGEEFDPTGLVVKEVYSDGTTAKVAYSDENEGDFTFTGFDASKPNESVTVTVTYKEKTAEFTVSVAANGIDPDKELASITVKTKPTKTAYTVGDALDPAGLVITATYSDGSTEDIAYNTTNFALTGFDSSAANESVTVTVTCNGKSATFTVSVAEAKEEKSLFETLSAQENNILAEDFATAFTPDTFGAGFGKVGVYGDSGVTVADGAISTGSGKNRKIHVDFGLVKEVVEGCVTLTVGGTQPQADKNLLTFYNGDSALFTLQTGSKAATATTAPVGGTAGTYEIYYKFDLTAKTVSLTVNGKAVLTDSALAVDSVSGYTIESHNGGKGTVAADDIAVCATKGDLATYKTQVKAWLATLVTNSYSEGKGYTVNKADVDAAKSAGDSAIDAAEDIDAVLAAYGNAKTALGQVKSDLAQAKANACDELDAYFPEGKTYTDDKLAAVNAAKEAGKTAINAATKTDDVETALDEAKKAIDALPDDNATAYTVTVKDSDGNDLGTVTAYTTVESKLDEIKQLAAAKNKVIKGGKFYTDQTCTSDYTTTEVLTGNITVYVELDEKTTMTYVLDASTATFAENKSTVIDGMKFEVNTSKSTPDSQNSMKVINLNGGLKTTQNYIKFTTTQTTSVTVRFFSSNADRYMKIITASDSNGKTGTEMTTTDKTVKETTFSNLPADTYYLGSGNSGIYIVSVTVTTE